MVWHDALVTNVDRTPRNTNMLMWHRQLWLIDHGAALYFHYDWGNYLQQSATPFPRIKEHVLLEFASKLPARKEISRRLAPAIVADVVDLIPDDWLKAIPCSQPPANSGPHTANTCSRGSTPRARSFRRRFVPDLHTYDYAVVRVVPRVERGEFVNAGIILYCGAADVLRAHIELDTQRLLALEPGVDVDAITVALAAIPAICTGGTGAGPLGLLSPRERFDWLVAERSTSIQHRRFIPGFAPNLWRRWSTWSRTWSGALPSAVSSEATANILSPVA